MRRTRARIAIRGGDTTQVTLHAPLLTSTPPAGCLGCIVLGPTAVLDTASDMPISVNRSTITLEAQGFPFETTTEDHPLAESNRDFDHRYRIETAGLELSFGLRGPGRSRRLPWMGGAAGLRPAMAVGSGSTAGGASRRFHPALVVAVGRACAELEFENLVSPGGRPAP